MHEEDKIVAWLKEIKFQKQIVGGVKEQDVWKKIRELHLLYLEAIAAERVRYKTHLNELHAGSDQSSLEEVIVTTEIGEAGE